MLYEIDKLPDLDLSVEEDEDASYDTSEYDEAMGTRPELPDYLDIEGDEDYDEVLGNCSSCLLLDDVLWINFSAAILNEAFRF